MLYVSEAKRGASVVKLEVNSEYEVQSEAALASAKAGPLAVDSSGNVFVVEEGTKISEYDGTGTLVEEFGSGDIVEPRA